jgi:hypothetical protein
MAPPGRPVDPKSRAPFVRGQSRTTPAAEEIENDKGDRVKPTSKSDFIRSQAAGLSATGIVSKAGAGGLTLSKDYVNMVRRESGGTKTKKSVSRSDFARARPATLSVAEVVAKGKAAGIKFTHQLVYNVRGSTSAMAAFVRGLPANTPAKDVVKQAKAAGIKLGIGYVYNIRGAAKIAAKKKRAGARSPAVSTVVDDGGWSVSQHAETLLRAVATEIGLGPAIEILQGERARVAAVIGG